MPSLNIFNKDAFTMQSLTASVNRLPYTPNFLGSLGMFSSRPIRTTVAMIEEKHGKLSLLKVSARGTMGDVRSREAREARPFIVPHVPQFQTIMADDIQDVRAFGSETELELVSAVVNDELMGMRQNHETTHEWHRVGAVMGKVLDADGTSVVEDYFAKFGGLTPTTDTMDFTPSTGDDLKVKSNGWHRMIGTNVGGQPYKMVLAICGDQFFDWLVTHATVLGAYDRWREGFMLRVSQLGPGYQAQSMNGLEYADILYINYRGKIGTQAFVPTEKAYITPIGVPDMYLNVAAPADMMGATNTRGQNIYAAQELLDFNKGVELHTQSNVLMVNTYPKAVVEVTGSST